MSPAPVHIRAHWVVTVGQPPIENGLVELTADSTGRSAVRKANPNEAAIDLGDSVILPGFVNAHTHLELTDLKDRVPFSGAFVDWLLKLMPQHPRRASSNAQAEAIQHGLQQSLSCGVTSLADIGGGTQAIKGWSTASSHVLGFLEMTGMGPRRNGAVGQGLAAIKDVSPQISEAVRIGLSPHAPYSTDAAVYQEVIQKCRQTGWPICTHLAETREEDQFLRHGTGPFRDMLESWGLWDGSFQVPGCSPVEYAQRLGMLDASPLLAHVNYVSDSDIDLLAASRAGVAYCPRTHAFFYHESHRYRDMLARGINVCLGTDSLASNDSLSILDELRFLRSIDRVSTNEELLTMATVNGARALGDPQTRLAMDQPDVTADWIAIPLEIPSASNPLEDLLRSSSTRVRHVFMNGVQVI